jgi:hypothetical protein
MKQPGSQHARVIALVLLVLALSVLFVAWAAWLWADQTNRVAEIRRSLAAQPTPLPASPATTPADGSGDALAARDRQLGLEKDLLQLESGGRVAIAQLTVGIFVGVAALANLWFTSRNLRLANRTAEIANRTLQTNQRGQVTDRFTKAIDQLGRTVDRGDGKKAEPHLEVRLGGLYALERIALDSRGSEDNYLSVVVEVLAAYVRENAGPSRIALSWLSSPVSAEAEDHAGGIEQKSCVDLLAVLVARVDAFAARIRENARKVTARTTSPHPTEDRRQTGYLPPKPRADIQTALTILGRLPNKGPIDLAGIDLRGADLSGADLHGACLDKADLYDAKLCGADLTRASLLMASLLGAELREAKLGEAEMDLAELGAANFHDAVGLTWDQVRDAKLSGRTHLPDHIEIPSDIQDSTLALLGWG